MFRCFIKRKDSRMERKSETICTLIQSTAFSKRDVTLRQTYCPLFELSIVFMIYSGHYERNSPMPYKNPKYD